jgi:hypothetical protein
MASNAAFARWHLGDLEWGDALRFRAVEVSGSTELARALPTRNRRSAPARPGTVPAPAAV